MPAAPSKLEHATLTHRRRVTAVVVAVLATAAIAALISRGSAILLDLSGLAASLWCF